MRRKIPYKPPVAAQLVTGIIILGTIVILLQTVGSMKLRNPFNPVHIYKPVDLPDGCSGLPGSDFQSVDLHEIGLGPDGPQMGRWSIHFHDASEARDDKIPVDWHYSDIVESGMYSCGANVLKVQFQASVLSARYDVESGILYWDGVQYEKQ